MRSLDDKPRDAAANAIVGDVSVPESRVQEIPLEAIFGPASAPVVEGGADLESARDRFDALFADDPAQNRPPVRSAVVTEAFPAALAPSPVEPLLPAARRRGIAAWSRRVRWSVGVAVVLVLAVVGASIFVGQKLAADGRRADAVAALEVAEAKSEAPRARLAAAAAAYDTAVADAQAAADSADAALAAVAGMSDQAALDAALAAQSDLAGALAALERPQVPDELEPPELVESTDVEAIDDAAERARAYARALEDAASDFDTAAAAIAGHVAALTAAQVALAASLPAAAALINDENPLAEQEFRDAVTAAAAAVAAAQTAGGSGDPELLAYALAVDALRADQTRAVDEAQRSSRTSRPANPAPQPTTPATEPAPTPDPEPEPEPEPSTEP